jgi:hypothetical protein
MAESNAPVGAGIFSLPRIAARDSFKGIKDEARYGPGYPPSLCSAK